MAANKHSRKGGLNAKGRANGEEGELKPPDRIKPNRKKEEIFALAWSQYNKWVATDS